MARIVSDHGWQYGPVGRMRVFEMDCGCDIRIEERTIRTLFDGRRLNLMTLLDRISDAHHCDIVVHHAPRRERDRNRCQEMARSWTIDPPMRIPTAPTPTVGFRLPAEAPERAVQRAAQQMRDEHVQAVMAAFAVP